ncbi:M23 family metallopeptidase [Desertihabitans aurantiacus]|uniref:M23 family metallopeptidase n=1 Tax=Desertihabitans aurantiacus TaxID=2282477 RepID=UPI000DF84E3A|nr:peptidoglycan DD-metalloendopeptidase family protein [Desertihabitans aurantiacus]
MRRTVSRPGWWRALALLLLLGVLSAAALPARAEPRWPDPAGWPLAGAPVVVRPFDLPAERWGAGHRGVDLAGTEGEPVRAAAAGTVAFAGMVAGRPVLSIDHGGLRTTYEPVRATVTVGARVRAGDPVGVLLAGHCPPGACLHWGLRQGEEYLDPTLLPTTVDADTALRLLPARSVGEAERAAEERRAMPSGRPGPPGMPGRHGFVAPSDGPLTSPFGPRLHPVLGVRKLHDGTDYGAPCGAPIRAAQDGTVVQRDVNAGYGNRLVVDHGDLGGHRFRTSYNHAMDWSVAVGERVRRGQVVGRVGTTGYSTGCHLHLMMWVDGGLVDPASWL